MNNKVKALIIISIILLFFITIMMLIMLSMNGNTAENEVTVVFNTVNGEELQPILISNEYELPTPIREGYIFMGWFSNSEYTGDSITSISPQGVENITVFAKWEIVKSDYDMSGAGWDYVSAFTYDNTAKAVSVIGLPNGVTVNEYTGNTATNAGSYTASVTLNYDSANYNEPSLADLNWNIAQATNSWTEALSISGWAYNESANAPTATAEYGTASFTYSDSETGTYTSTVPTNVGTFWVKANIEATINHTGLESLTSFVIVKAQLTEPNITGTYTYTGSELTVAYDDYDVEIMSVDGDTTGTNADDYTLTFTILDTTNYEWATGNDGTVGWTILKADYDMSEAGWDYTGPFTYDGALKTVNVTDLPTGVTISQSTNTQTTNAGTFIASVTLNYDSVNYNDVSIPNLEWTILKADYDMSEAVWNYAGPFTYDGNLKSVVITGLPSGVTIIQYMNSQTANAGTYTASVTLNYDSANYNEISIPDLQWTISKADYDMSGAGWNYAGPFTYDGNLKSVVITGLPSGVTIIEYMNSQTANAGTYTASVTLNYDSANYNEISIPDLQWTIAKADYDMSGASWNYTEPFIYDGSEKTVEVTGLPSGVSVNQYTDNSKTLIGTYTANVTFNYDYPNNYNEPSIADLQWEIELFTGNEG